MTSRAWTAWPSITSTAPWPGCDALGCRGAAGAGAVLDADRLSERGGQLLGQEARHEVAGPALGVADDELHRSARIGLRPPGQRRYGKQESEDHTKLCTTTADHDHGLPPVRGATRWDEPIIHRGPRRNASGRTKWDHATNERAARATGIRRAACGLVCIAVPTFCSRSRC